MSRILIIEDHPQVSNVLRRILEAVGYEVGEASSGWDGLQQLRECPADLVITDLLVPLHDGLDTILQMTREFPKVKIIAVTGASWDFNVLDVAKALGASHAFAKPFEADALIDAVHEELDDPSC